MQNIKSTLAGDIIITGESKELEKYVHDLGFICKKRYLQNIYLRL